jgi:drug/metabolite transporter (DMT)-like permease
VLTWGFGGQSGYSSGIGNTLVWFTAIFVAIYEAFEKFLLDESQHGEMKFAAAVCLIFVFGLIPISWYSIVGFAPSAVLGPLSVLAYVVYGVYLAYAKTNGESPKENQLHKIGILPIRFQPHFRLSLKCFVFSHSV